MNQARTSKHPEFAPEAQRLPEVPAPAAINKNWIRPEQVESVKGLGWAKHFYDAASDSWDKLNKLRSSVRPEMTRAAHQMEVNRQFQRASESVGKTYDTAKQRLKEARDSYRAELDTTTGLHTTGPHDAELRSVLRSMPERKRHQALIDAIEQGDRETVRAALTAPALTVGLEPDKLQNLRAMFERKAAPEIVGALAEIDKAEKQLVNGYDAWLSEGDKLAFTKEIRQAQQAQRQADEIGRGFEQEPAEDAA